MNNNTLTPETYNVETAYNIVMTDNGSTYLGDYAKAWNKQVGSLLMELTVYANNKQLPNPTLVAKLEKVTRSSRSGNTIKKSPNGSITISQTRLSGTPLENYNEITMTINSDGHIVLSPVITNAQPASDIMNDSPAVDISIDQSAPALVE